MVDEAIRSARKALGALRVDEGLAVLAQARASLPEGLSAQRAEIDELRQKLDRIEGALQ